MTSDLRSPSVSSDVHRYFTSCKGTYPLDPSDPPPPIPSPSDTSVYMFSSHSHLTTISLFIHTFILRLDPPSDPITFICSSSGLYSIIVRYLFILFPEPSTACPRAGTVYIPLPNTCYGFPQINSLWIPLTGSFLSLSIIFRI